MKNLLNIYGLLVFCFLLVSCEPRSLEDFRAEGQSVTQSLMMELQKIQNREDLLQKVPRLKSLFDELIDVMIRARGFREKHQLEPLAITKEDHELSDHLRIELNRVYKIEGAVEVIEKCQEDALHRLDAFEKHLQKYKNR